MRGDPRITEEQRRRSIWKRLSKMESKPGGAPISTGMNVLDAALGGGLPRGRVVEVYGPASCGKTTLALQIVAHRQRTGATVGWIDAEHSFDPSYAATGGVLVDRMAVVQPESAEQALEMMRKLALSGAVELLVLDSAAALVPGVELGVGIGASGPGLHGRVLASGLHSLATILTRTEVALLILNQTRGHKEPTGAEHEISAGGAALKLHSAVRIALRPAGGRRVRFRVLKNKVTAAFGEGELDWNPGSGFAKTP